MFVDYNNFKWKKKKEQPKIEKLEVNWNNQISLIMINESKEV